MSLDFSGTQNKGINILIIIFSKQSNRVKWKYKTENIIIYPDQNYLSTL